MMLARLPGALPRALLLRAAGAEEKKKRGGRPFRVPSTKVLGYFLSVPPGRRKDSDSRLDY
jgi:hypothetical protein